MQPLSEGMQYIEVKFGFSFREDYLRDLFVQGLADMGFESFTDDAAYIPAHLLDESALRTFAFENEQAILSITAVPDQNWNAAWEAEHPVMELPFGVRITPHCAFGSGHHETTSMMVDALLACDLRGKTVLDMGCGTGVLAIFAKKRGAAHVVAVDIDEKSVANTKENTEANGVTLDIRQADMPPQGKYDIILANIHRNILIAQMFDYERFLQPDGELWLSGFYEADCLPIASEAARYGLEKTEQNQRGEWCRLVFKKPKK